MSCLVRLLRLLAYLLGFVVGFVGCWVSAEMVCVVCSFFWFLFICSLEGGEPGIRSERRSLMFTIF